MKEGFQHIDNDIIFREIFRDEQTVRRNHGVPTDVAFAEGIGSFNGTTSLLQHRKRLNGVYSIRINIDAITRGAADYFFSTELRGGIGTGIIFLNTLTTVFASTGTVYVDKVATTTISDDSKEIVVTGITLISSIIHTGSAWDAGGKIACDFDLIEIYNRTLDADEVLNL